MIKVDQITDDQWAVKILGTRLQYFFDDESEAVNMASKLNFATQAQGEATGLSQIADRLSNLETVYFDRGYNAGGSNPIVDGDITSLGFTAANLAAMITLIQQFNNFLAGPPAEVIEGDYDSTLNLLRSDM